MGRDAHRLVFGKINLDQILPLHTLYLNLFLLAIQYIILTRNNVDGIMFVVLFGVFVCLFDARFFTSEGHPVVQLSCELPLPSPLPETQLLHALFSNSGLKTWFDMAYMWIHTCTTQTKMCSQKGYGILLVTVSAVLTG